MRKFFAFAILTICMISISCANKNSTQKNIEGSWIGKLKVPQGIDLELVFEFSKTADGYSATLGVPQQNAKGLKVEDVVVDGNAVSLKVNLIKASFEGQLNDEGDKITGTFTQHGVTLPLTLTPGEVKKPNRPQTPQAPFPYDTEEVKFENKAEGFTLAGTLTLPKGKKGLTAVVMLTGSGLQNRDEEIFGHKPFWVIADYLTRNGIAVLRFDDRGFGESGGNVMKVTTFDFATDAQSAINYLKSRPEIDSTKIGLIGHSEGANVAFITASLNPKDINFIVSLAGMGETGKQTLMRQNETLSKAKGMPDQQWKAKAIVLDAEYTILMQDKPFDQIIEDAKADALKKMPPQMRDKESERKKLEIAISTQITPWFTYFLKLNPAQQLAKIKCPVLALNGDKDFQVEPNANIEAIETSLHKAGNKQVTTKIYPGLNHLFQTCQTGMLDEYGQIEETINPQVLSDILSWMRK